MTDLQLIYAIRERMAAGIGIPGELSQLKELERRVASAADMPQGRTRPAGVTGSAWGHKKSAPVDDD